MEQPIMFEGKEYKDELIIVSTVEVSFWTRVYNVFCPTMHIRTEVYMEELVPKHKVVLSLYTVSYWRRFMARFRKNRGMEIMGKPPYNSTEGK